MEYLKQDDKQQKLKVNWQNDNQATNCNNCKKAFRIYRRKHHCRACGKIFCSNCCRDWILLPETFGYPDPVRTCILCLKRHGSLNWSRKEDIMGEENDETIILLPPHLMTRKSLQLIAEKLSERYRVISMDLPGLGTRRGEKLMMSTCVNALKEVIEKYCSKKKAHIAGFGIGGYVSMVFARMYPEYCDKLILGGCCVEYPPIKSQFYTTTVGFVFKLTPEEERWKIIPDTFPSIPRDILDKLVLRDGIDYSQWSAFAKLVQEEKSGFYLECISKIKSEILFLNSEYDFRNSEEVFLQSAGDRGTLRVIKDADSMAIIDPKVFQLITNEIFEFVSPKKELTEIKL